MTIGAKLRQLRAQRGESLQTVADAVGASKAHIWQIEIGRSRNPSLELIRRLADHFELSVSSLVGEAPENEAESDDAMVLFRDIKNLTEEDRAILRLFIDSLKKKRHEKR